MKVYITRRIPEEAISFLKEQGVEVDIHEEETAPDRNTLLMKGQQVDAILCLLSDSIDREFLDHARNLKVVANFAVGYNNIDVNYARQKGIAVTNTPDVLTDATADLTWALILSVTRRIVEADNFVRAGKFEGWGPLMMLGTELSGKTLGIVGAGRIGQAVGKRAVGFSINILYADNSRKGGFEQVTGAQKADLADVFSGSDILTFHCPLKPETRHLINEDTINKVKPGAYIINTSRGPVIDEGVLVKALKEGYLSGAGLDVYENEPELHPGLAELSNVVLLPHIGSATHQTRTDMAMIAARNIVAVLNGERPLTPVN